MEEQEYKEPEFLNQNPTENLSIHDKFLLLKVKYLRLSKKDNNRRKSLRQLNKRHADTRFTILGLRSELRNTQEDLVASERRVEDLDQKVSILEETEHEVAANAQV